MKKSKNAGFSIVELMIVIAILAVMLSMMAVSINYISSTNKKQVANNIISYLGKAQTTAMSKQDEYGVQIGSVGSKTTVKMVYREEGASSWSTYGDAYVVPSNVPIKIVSSDGSVVDITGGASGSTVAMIFTFDRTTGGFNNCYKNGAVASPASQIQVGPKNINITWRTGKFVLE